MKAPKSICALLISPPPHPSGESQPDARADHGGENAEAHANAPPRPFSLCHLLCLPSLTAVAAAWHQHFRHSSKLYREHLQHWAWLTRILASESLSASQTIWPYRSAKSSLACSILSATGCLLARRLADRSVEPACRALASLGACLFLVEATPNQVGACFRQSHGAGFPLLGVMLPSLGGAVRLLPAHASPPNSRRLMRRATTRTS